MAQYVFTKDEKDALIAAGILAAGAIAGTLIVMAAYRSYKRGDIITEFETPTREQYREINLRIGNCDECGAEDIGLCNGYFGNTSLPKNHCFRPSCGRGLHYESLGWCLECAKWDYADDD